MRYCRSSSTRLVRSKHVLTSVGVFLMSLIKVAIVSEAVIVAAMGGTMPLGSGMVGAEFECDGQQVLLTNDERKAMVAKLRGGALF